jgi:photosystem II stability/assembly factor-like uncharacterized protein
MKNKRVFSVFLLAALILSACLPPPPPVLTATPHPPTETVLPPTELPTPTTVPTITPTPVVLLNLSQVTMFDAETGWGWATPVGASDANLVMLLVRTEDSGQNWENVTPPNAQILPGSNFFLDAQTAWLTTFDTSAATASLLQTTDGGKTWTTISDTLSPNSARLYFSDAQQGWLTTYDIGAGNARAQLFETSDGGATFAPINLLPPAGGPPDQPAGTIHLCNICGDTLIYDPLRAVITRGDLADDPGKVVRLSISTNLGKNWKDLKLPLPAKEFSDHLIAPLKPFFFNETDGTLPVLMAKNDANEQLVGTLAFYATKDNGKSWTVRPGRVDGLGVSPVIDFVSDQDVFVSCGDNLCVTHDGAKTWETLEPDNFISGAGGESVEQLHFIDLNMGFAIATTNDNTALLRTSDGGLTWDRLIPVLMP